MSELKTYFLGKNNGIEFAVYLKSEADKVIAEKDKEYENLKRENESLKGDIADLCDDRKSSVAIIDELNAENAQLKAKLESIQASMYADAVDLGMEIRRLKRALWLMTAEWAEAMGLASCNIANKFMSRENFEVSDEYRNKTVKKYRHRQVVFYKYADYSRQKAKEGGR